MKQAITGAKIFSGNEFFDHKALLIDGEKIISSKLFLSGELLKLLMRILFKITSKFKN